MTPEEEAGLRAEMERLCAENVRLRAQMAEKDAYLVKALARRRSSVRQPRSADSTTGWYRSPTPHRLLLVLAGDIRLADLRWGVFLIN